LEAYRALGTALARPVGPQNNPSFGNHCVCPIVGPRAARHVHFEGQGMFRTYSSYYSLGCSHCRKSIIALLCGSTTLRWRAWMGDDVDSKETITR
jgi:hypothetical protein